MRDRFLIDECLSGDLVASAKARGYEADYVPHIGKGGWQDWNLVPFAVENDYIVVTLNRRDFLKQHAALDVHPGLVILIPQAPRDKRSHQADLFEKALEAFAAMNDDLLNKVMEVLEEQRACPRVECGRTRYRPHQQSEVAVDLWLVVVNSERLGATRCRPCSCAIC